jgi:hypothetical protein
MSAFLGVFVDPPPAQLPEWPRLGLAFAGALLIALCLAAFVVRSRWSSLDQEVTLEKAFDFSKSWVTNFALLTAGLLAVFGKADVIKAITRREHPDVVGLLAVAAALAAVLAGLAVFVLGARVTDKVRAWRLVLAAVMTVTGTTGVLMTVALAVPLLALGSLANGIVVVVVAASLLLLGGYVVPSLRNLLYGVVGTSVADPQPLQLAQQNRAAPRVGLL